MAEPGAARPPVPPALPATAPVPLAPAESAPLRPPAAPAPGAPASASPAAPAEDLALPPLPPPAGPARAVLMLVNPRLLFLYCVRDARLEQALPRAAGAAEARVEVSADGRSFEEAARHPFDFRAPDWYFPNSTIDCVLRLRLGVREGDGFRALLTSNAVRVPRESAGEAPERWAALDELRRAAAPRAPLRPRRAPDPAPRPAGAALPPGSGTTWEPGPRLGAGGGDGTPALGDVCIVLHSHLPFVRHPEREYFLEEHWLFEAITETYLPLLDMFEHLAGDGVPGRMTVSLTPTLTAMLRDPSLMGKYERHLERMCDLGRREVERTRRDPDFGPVAGFYRDRLERLRWLFARRYARDLVGGFADLEAEGRVEILACAATHALLPNLALQPACVRAQIETGVREHRRQIGRDPRGIWLPECAYFEGLDAILAGAGLDYFFVDAHAAHNASSRPRSGVHAPLFCPAGVAAFGRDEESGVQVWSSREGYPGDPAYRDFYRDIGYDLEYATVAPYLDPSGRRGMTGFKYHRITGRSEPKEPYRREGALRTLERHAADFAGNRGLQIRHLAAPGGPRPLVVAMYDAELFGHWWFEGPEWMEAVLRRLPGRGLRAVTPSQVLDESPRGQVAEPSASSWGERGYYDVWIGEANDWILPPLHDAGRRMVSLASRPEEADPLRRRALAQAGRELLLAQASDWPFILKNQTAVEYARRRVHEHLDRFDALARMLEAGPVDGARLAEIESRDNLFPEIDPRLWREP